MTDNEQTIQIIQTTTTDLIPSLPGWAPCGCYVGIWGGTIPAPRCSRHQDTFNSAPCAPLHPWIPMQPFQPDPVPIPTEFTTTVPFITSWPSLSDADVDRVARRLMNVMREQGMLVRDPSSDRAATDDERLK